MNRNLIFGVLIIAALTVGAAFLIKTPPSQKIGVKTTTGITSAPTNAVAKPSSTGEAVSEEVKEITVIGSNFRFDPKTIKVKKGDKVRITFKSSGGLHNFVIDELNVRTPMITGGDSQVVEFTADKSGSFQYYCSFGNHRAMGMWGTLTVE